MASASKSVSSPVAHREVLSKTSTKQSSLGVSASSSAPAAGLRYLPSDFNSRDVIHHSAQMQSDGAEGRKLRRTVRSLEMCLKSFPFASPLSGVIHRNPLIDIDEDDAWMRLKTKGKKKSVQNPLTRHEEEEEQESKQRRNRQAKTARLSVSGVVTFADTDHVQHIMQAWNQCDNSANISDGFSKPRNGISRSGREQQQSWSVNHQQQPLGNADEFSHDESFHHAGYTAKRTFAQLPASYYETEKETRRQRRGAPLYDHSRAGSRPRRVHNQHWNGDEVVASTGGSQSTIEGQDPFLTRGRGVGIYNYSARGVAPDNPIVQRQLNSAAAHIAAQPDEAGRDTQKDCEHIRQRSHEVVPDEVQQKLLWYSQKQVAEKIKSKLNHRTALW